MSDNIYKKIANSRKPRVHIKYEVETEDGIIEQELPFTVGVLGDFSGQKPLDEKLSLKEREFINIDRNNFDQILAKINPKLKLDVKNCLQTNSDSSLKVDLSFSKMSDFEPDNIVKKVPALAELLEIRGKLKDLLNRSDSNPNIENALNALLQDSGTLKAIAEEL